MDNPASYDAARAAKQAVAQRYQAEPWFRGVGVARGAEGFAVRLNVSPDAVAAAVPLPSQQDGVPVEIVVLEEYKAR